MIFHCFSDNLQEAAEFMLMMDAILVIFGLWSVIFVSNDVGHAADAEKNARQNAQTLAAMMGLPAAALIKVHWRSPQAVRLALFTAMGATIVYIFSLYKEFIFMGVVSDLLNNHEITVDGWYWPFEYINCLFIVVLAANHGLLAKFSLEHAKTPRKDAPVLCNLQRGDHLRRPSAR